MLLLMSDFHEGIVCGVIIILFLVAVIHFREEDEDDFLNWRE